jgi:hypothetical protein
MPSQSGIFTVEFDAVPNNANMDGLTGLSNGLTATFNDSAVTVRFNSDGNLDAWDEAVAWYESDTVIAYTPGTTYRFRLVVNVPAHVYTVYVTEEGSSEQLLGAAYQFRSQQSSVASLDQWSVWSFNGTHDVCNFTVEAGGNQPPTTEAGANQTIVLPTDSVTLNATVNDDGQPAPPGTVTVAWTATSGPGPVVFGDSAAVDTTASFSVEGTYVLRLTADDGELSSFDELAVTLQSPEPPALSLSPTELDLGTVATQVSFEVWNSGGDTLGYSVTDDATWLTVSPTAGDSSGEHDTIIATVDRSGLADGQYQAAITVTPSVGSPRTVAVSMSAGVVTGGLVPIARWDVVPYQRVNAGQVLKCGVVAFSKAGVARVRFSPSGQGFTGPSGIDVNSMTHNDQSGVHEYWFGLAADDFASDGRITLNATVYGSDGGTRVLEPLTFVVNPNGTLPHLECWVDATSGNDGAGTVNDSGRPFATVGRAIDAIRNWRSANGWGNNADGGIVRLNPGQHTALSSVGAIACSDEWVTVTTAAGGDRSNTSLAGAGIIWDVAKCAVKGVTLDGATASGSVVNSSSATRLLWIHDSDCIGQGRWGGAYSMVGINFAAIFWTDSYITNVRFGVQPRITQLCRGLTIEHTGDDVFQNVPMVVNCTADDINPGPTSWHSDAWQHWGGTEADDNCIVYNYRATNCYYQGIFIRGRDNTPSPPNAQGMAMVNLYVEMHPDAVGTNDWYRRVDHLIWWHCTFANAEFNIFKDPYDGNYWDVEVTDFSAIGNCFYKLQLNQSDAGIDWSGWSHNHFQIGSGGLAVTRGTDQTIGDPRLDAFGRPMAGSPLFDRVSPACVPGDLTGTSRATPSDVGAYEAN